MKRLLLSVRFPHSLFSGANKQLFFPFQVNVSIPLTNGVRGLCYKIRTEFAPLGKKCADAPKCAGAGHKSYRINEIP